MINARPFAPTHINRTDTDMTEQTGPSATLRGSPAVPRKPYIHGIRAEYLIGLWMGGGSCADKTHTFTELWVRGCRLGCGLRGY